MADIEEERKRLTEILRESLLVMGDIEKMQELLDGLRKEAVGLYKEIDKKLNGN